MCGREPVGVRLEVAQHCTIALVGEIECYIPGSFPESTTIGSIHFPSEMIATKRGRKYGPQGFCIEVDCMLPGPNVGSSSQSRCSTYPS